MKKIITALLVICTVLSTVAFAGYGEHDHKLMKSADDETHYEECQVCTERFEVEDHSFVDGMCTVCGHRELVNPFIDVVRDVWYYKDIVKAVSTGIINGKTPNEFKPEELLTYAEAVKLAACMNQVYVDGRVTLKNGDPWYQTYADYCTEKGIITKEYNYNENVTRAGYIEIFANALPDEAFKDINNIPDGSIIDVDGKAPYTIYVYKLYRAGIISGVDAEHRCNPEASIRRCEVATIISRMMDDNMRVQFTISDSDVELPDGDDTIIVVPDVEKPNTDYPDLIIDSMKGPLTVEKHPENYNADAYGIKIELEVRVTGGKAPYTYEWYYNGYRNQKTKIENGDYVKDAESEALILSVEKENILLGKGLLCKVTDAEGTEVTTNTARVYGPFSMPVESVLIGNATKEYTVTGRVADGTLAKGERVSIERNGKIIAIGTVTDIQMFGKSLDECVKDDNAGLVFVLEKGVRPQSGDTVIRYVDGHVIDTSDIVN